MPAPPLTSGSDPSAVGSVTVVPSPVRLSTLPLMLRSWISLVVLPSTSVPVTTYGLPAVPEPVTTLMPPPLTTVSDPSAVGSVTVVNGGGINVVTGSGTAGSPYVVTGTEVDGSTTNEIQDLSISGNVLSLTGDGTTVTLPTADGTETGVTAGSNVTVTGDGSIATPYVVGVASLDDADADPNNEIQDLAISGNVLSLTGDGTTVTLPTADGSETVLNNGTNTVVNGSGTTASPYTIDVPDNTDDQDLSLTGDVLSLTGDGTTVNLSGYTNTDNQDLSISGNVLSLTGDGTTVTLPTVD